MFDLLTLKEVTADEARETFEGRGAKDHVSYYEGKNTRWYLFGDENPLGHAAMIKIGSGSKEWTSSHFRFGRWFIDPQHRGSSAGALYAGALIYYYLSHEMSSDYKVITMHAWDRLVPQYEKNGWVQTSKKFKGPFKQLRKLFYTSWQGELIEQSGMSGKVCEGIIYPDDYRQPIVVIPLHNEEGTTYEF